MNVFLDTSIVNRILDLEERREADQNWQEDVKCLKLILEGPVAADSMTLYVNPTVRQEIDNTRDERRKAQLLLKYQEYHFTEFNLTIFPFHFPAKFISKEQVIFIQRLCREHPALLKDQKIIADAAFDDSVDFLLTTDRKLARGVGQVGKMKVVLPKKLWEIWENSTKSNM